jgi:acyl-CoA thioester hydrolase
MQNTAKTPVLSAITEVKVRFSEVDSLRIVWHGHYLKYFEEGREAFGAKYGISYLDVFDQGLLTPLVKTNCEYKLPLEYGDTAVVETIYRDSEAAKICFDFIIRSKNSGQIACTGSSMQIFLNKDRELLLTVPEYFQQWKQKVGLIS